MVIFVLVQALRQDRPPLLPFALFHDRNFALMSSVSVIISIGLVGMWLPMSIYLQTILGFSPLKAGLTIAPSALASGFTAPFAGRLADRAGKALLVTGFTLYALGLAVIVLAAMPTSQWYDLLPGYLIAGLGVGCTISPMQTIATRNVSPPLAGAASGVMNTARQAGSALGSAICLAVLQNRLAAHESFITAMRAAIAVPVGLLLAAAVACTAIRRGAVRRPAAAGQAASAGGAAFAGGAASVGGSSAGGSLAGTSSTEAWLQPPAPEPRRLGAPPRTPGSRARPANASPRRPRPFSPPRRLRLFSPPRRPRPFGPPRRPRPFSPPRSLRPFSPPSRPDRGRPSRYGNRGQAVPSRCRGPRARRPNSVPSACRLNKAPPIPPRGARTRRRSSRSPGVAGAAYVGPLARTADSGGAAPAAR